MAQDAVMVIREGVQKTQRHQPQTGTYGQHKKVQRVAVAGKSPPPRVTGAQTHEGVWVKNSLKSQRSPQWWRNLREV